MGRKEMWQAYACTLEGVRSGRPPFEIAHGMPFWNYVDAQGEFARTFFAAFADWTDAHNQVVEAFDFGRFRNVIDVGGGMGVLLEGILEPLSRRPRHACSTGPRHPSAQKRLRRPAWPNAADSWRVVFSIRSRSATTPMCSST